MCGNIWVWYIEKPKGKSHGFLPEEGCFGIPLSVYKEGDFMKK